MLILYVTKIVLYRLTLRNNKKKLKGKTYSNKTEKEKEKKEKKGIIGPGGEKIRSIPSNSYLNLSGAMFPAGGWAGR